MGFFDWIYKGYMLRYHGIDTDSEVIAPIEIETYDNPKEYYDKLDKALKTYINDEGYYIEEFKIKHSEWDIDIHFKAKKWLSNIDNIGTERFNWLAVRFNDVCENLLNGDYYKLVTNLRGQIESFEYNINNKYNNIRFFYDDSVNLRGSVSILDSYGYEKHFSTHGDKRLYKHDNIIGKIKKMRDNGLKRPIMGYHFLELNYDNLF